MKQARKPTEHSLQLACLALQASYPALTPETLNAALLAYDGPKFAAPAPMLTPAQICEQLQLHPTTVWRWLREGKIKGMKVSRKKWLVPQSELENVNQIKEQK